MTLFQLLTIKRDILCQLVTLFCNTEACRKAYLCFCVVKNFCSFDFLFFYFISFYFIFPQSMTATYLQMNCMCLFCSSSVLSWCTAKLVTLHFLFLNEASFCSQVFGAELAHRASRTRCHMARAFSLSCAEGFSALALRPVTI